MKRCRRWFCSLALGAGFLFLGVLRAEAAVWYVDAAAPAGGDGTSWATAFRHPQTALDPGAAVSGDQVWVKAGSYLRRVPSDTVVLTMVSGVEIYGGFDGTETSLAQRDPAAHLTLLQGAPSLVQHVVVGAASARLDGLTVRGGVTTSPGSAGGGLYNVSASLTVARVVFQGNRAETGGAIYNAGSLLIEDCTFTGNSARISGGAIHNGGGLTVLSSDFVGNTAQHSDQLNGVGGAIANRFGTALIEDCTFRNNGAGYDGGAIHDAGLTTIRNGLFDTNSATAGGAIHTTFPGSGASIEGCTFVGNSVAEAWREGCDEFLFCYDGYYGGKGGAIYDVQSSTSITSSSFLQNSAINGGALFDDAATPMITDSLFSQNTATNQGGATAHLNSAPSFVDCSFEGNSANVGGAFQAEGHYDYSGVVEPATIVRGQLLGNHADSEGGAVYVRDGSVLIEGVSLRDNDAAAKGGAISHQISGFLETSSLEIRGSLLAGNTALQGGAMHLVSGCGASISTLLLNSTVVDNEATTAAGALANEGCVGASVLNSILWGNSAPASPEISGLASVSYSDVAGGFAGTGNLAVDPIFVDPLAGNYHLAPLSPVIDRGTNSGAATSDIDGDARPVDGDGNGSAIVDMGADEYTGPACVGQPDIDGDGWCDVTDNCPATANPNQADTGRVGPGPVPDGIGDACQCSDVTGDGAGDATDVSVYRSSLAQGASPPLPAKCNAAGVAGAAGTCDVLDVVVLRRAIDDLDPGVSQVCTAATGPP